MVQGSNGIHPVSLASWRLGAVERLGVRLIYARRRNGCDVTAGADNLHGAVSYLLNGASWRRCNVLLASRRQFVRSHIV